MSGCEFTVKVPSHEAMDLPPLLHQRAPRFRVPMPFGPEDQRLSLKELALSPRPYSSVCDPPRSLLVVSLCTSKSPFRSSFCPALYGAGPTALTAVRNYYEDPDFSPCIGKAFRTLPYSPAYPSGSSALRHELHPQEHDEISPGQTPLFPSVLPAHTLSQNTLRRYFLRPEAASSDQRAHGRPVHHGFRLGYGPEVRRKPFGFHLTMDTLPSLCLTTQGRRVLPGFLSTHPPCEGAAGLSPARKAPCWAHNPDPKKETVKNELSLS